MLCEAFLDSKKLNEAIDIFTNNPTKDNLGTIMRYLVVTDLLVPGNVAISPAKYKAVINSNSGDKVTFRGSLNFRPDWRINEFNGKIYFPIFSTLDNIDEEYRNNHSWINMNLDTCMNYVDSNKRCNGLLLNFNSIPIIIEDSNYQILKKIRKTIAIEINKDNIDDINYKDVIAMTIAEGGAMGEPNGFYAVISDMQVYHSYIGNKILLDKFTLLKNFNCGLTRVSNLDKGFNWFNLGAGNYLILRKKYYDKFVQGVKTELGEKYRDVDLYNSWYDILWNIIYKK